jgi:O-antigen/teichoic acid export membrane protein
MSDAPATSLATSVPRNTGWLFAGRVLAQGLAVVMTVVLAARLGVGGLGEYAFVSAVVLLANVGTTFGTDMVLIREIAGHGRLDRWPAALAVQLVLSVVAVAIIWGAAPFIPGQSVNVVVALRILSLSLLPAAVFSVGTAVLRGAGRMRAYAVVGVIAAAIQLAAVAAIVGSGSDVEQAALALLVGQILVAVVTWLICAGLVTGMRAVPATSRSDVLAMAGASASIGVLGLLGILYQRLGAIAVSVMVGPVATGWYAGASRVAEASKTGHLALFGAVYPAMAEAKTGEAAAAAHHGLQRSWRACLVLGALVSAGLLLIGPWLIEVLYGPSFVPSQNALRILALSIVPSTAATYQSLALLADHRDDETLWIQVVSLVALAVLLAGLVASFGWLGACWAVLGAETARAALMVYARYGSAVGVGRTHSSLSFDGERG